MYNETEGLTLGQCGTALRVTLNATGLAHLHLVEFATIGASTVLCIILALLSIQRSSYEKAKRARKKSRKIPILPVYWLLIRVLVIISVARVAVVVVRQLSPVHTYLLNNCGFFCFALMDSIPNALDVILEQFTCFFLLQHSAGVDAIRRSFLLGAPVAVVVISVQLSIEMAIGPGTSFSIFEVVGIPESQPVTAIVQSSCLFIALSIVAIVLIVRKFQLKKLNQQRKTVRPRPVGGNESNTENSLTSRRRTELFSANDDDEFEKVNMIGRLRFQVERSRAVTPVLSFFLCFNVSRCITYSLLVFFGMRQEFPDSLLCVTIVMHVMDVITPFFFMASVIMDSRFWASFRSEGIGSPSSSSTLSPRTGEGVPSSDVEQHVRELENLGVSRRSILRRVDSRLTSLLPSTRRLATRIISYDDVVIEGKFAEGGFGTVYRGSLIGKPVAVKIAKFFDMDTTIIADTMREANTLASISKHPRIVRFIGLFLRPPQVGLVMELCGGGSLARKVRPSSHRSKGKGERSLLQWDNAIPSSMLQLVRYAMECAEALCYLHSTLRMVHRDLKAANFVLTDDDHVKLTDLGEALKIRRRGTKDRGMELNKGTLRWMANEVMAGQVEQAKRRSCLRSMVGCGHIQSHIVVKGKVLLASEAAQAADIYSFAMVMYEIFEHRIPFDEIGWDSQVEDLVLAGQRPILTPPFWPPELFVLVQRCWDPSFMERPSIETVLDVLQKTKQRIETELINFEDDSGYQLPRNQSDAVAIE